MKMLREPEWYHQFVDTEASLLLKGTPSSWVLTMKQPDRMVGALGLWMASDSEACEAILDSRAWNQDSSMVTCPHCDGEGCRWCRARGVLPVDFQEMIVVIGGDTIWRIEYHRDEQRRPIDFGEPEEMKDAAGMLADLVEQAVIKKAEIDDYDPLHTLINVWLLIGGTAWRA